MAMDKQVLCKENHNEVYIACSHRLAAHWRDLGLRLGVPNDTLNIIRADRGGNVTDCLAEMLAEWLKQNVVSSEFVPTWQNLCKAVEPIDLGLAQALAKEHNCTISNKIVSDIQQQSPSQPQSAQFAAGSPVFAFLSHSCGCGRCPLIGWVAQTGVGYYICENVSRVRLELVPLDANRFSFLNTTEMCARTAHLANRFHTLCIATWEKLHAAITLNPHLSQDMVHSLSRFLSNQSLPSAASLPDLIHFLCVSWCNYDALLHLAEKFLPPTCADIMQDWNDYSILFSNYCYTFNLNSFASVFFEVRDHGVFKCKVDHYGIFTHADLITVGHKLRRVLRIPPSSLVPLAVTPGCLVIYFHYCSTDYLDVFKSLTAIRLKKISKIKDYRILSLTDVHNQFTYNDIQSYNNDQEEHKPASSKASGNKSQFEEADKSKKHLTEAKPKQEKDKDLQTKGKEIAEIKKMEDQKFVVESSIPSSVPEGKGEVVSTDTGDEEQDSSENCLSINDFEEVFEYCEPVSAQWRDLGTRLGVLEPALTRIEAESSHRGHDAYPYMRPILWLPPHFIGIGHGPGHAYPSCIQLRHVIEIWLTRPEGEVHESVFPTWKNLCEALLHLDHPGPEIAHQVAQFESVVNITSELPY